MFWIYVSHVDIYIPKHFAVSLFVISIGTAVYKFWNSLLLEYPFGIYISYSIFVFCLVKKFWKKRVPIRSQWNLFTGEPNVIVGDFQQPTITLLNSVDVSSSKESPSQGLPWCLLLRFYWRRKSPRHRHRLFFALQSR